MTKTVITIDNLPALLRNLKRLGLKTVMVGVPGAKAGRKKVGKEADAMNNPTLAYIHEHGSPLDNIPARPFIAPGIKKAADKISKHLQKAGEVMLSTGDQDAVDRELHTVGTIAQRSIRSVINEGPPPALAKSTLAARRRRGHTGTVPLIDTGQLRNSITYVLKEEK